MKLFFKATFKVIFSIIAIALTGFFVFVSFRYCNNILNSYKNQIKPQESITDWSKLPKDFQKFSEKNSLKIELETESENFVITGTAWSWYYEKKTETSYDWYLMTNFHVVNETIAYVNGLTILEKDKDGNEVVNIKNPGELEKYYANNIVTNLPLNKLFNLKRYSFTSKSYDNLISSKSDNDKLFIKSISFITDFNNESIDLFSKSEANKVLYNLDMALVKISMDFSKNLKLLDSKYHRPNIYLNYLSNSLQEPEKRYKFNEANTIFIAGNPAISKQLLGTLVNPRFEYDDNNLSISNPILKELKAPYYYSESLYKNFELSGGASGSAVFQYLNDDEPFIDWEKIVPVGIYWGGKSHQKELFKPSFIPFILNKNLPPSYSQNINVFENFKNSLNNL